MQNTSYKNIFLAALTGPKRIRAIGVNPDPHTIEMFKRCIPQVMQSANEILAADQQYKSLSLIINENIPKGVMVIEYEDGTQDHYQEEKPPMGKRKFMVGIEGHA